MWIYRGGLRKSAGLKKKNDNKEIVRLLIKKETETTPHDQKAERDIS